MRFVIGLVILLLLVGCTSVPGGSGNPAESESQASAPVLSGYGERLDNGSVEPIDPSMTQETEQPAGTVVMSTEFPEYPVGTDKITLLFSTDVKSAFITYGEYWNCEVYTDGAWRQIPFQPNETIHDIAYILGEQWEYYNGVATMTHELSRLDYEFHPGRYRILKEFGGVMYAAEFSLIEE